MKAFRGFSSVALRTTRKLDEYSVYSPTPLNIKTFIDIVQHAPASRSFEFLRHELPIRLANIMKEVSLLPESLISTAPLKKIIDMYNLSFDEILTFESKKTNNSTISDFTETLNMIRNRHAPVIQLMAEGIREMKSLQPISMAEDRQLQYFLDRFYTSRIGIRLLLTQQGELFGDGLNLHNRLVGCIDPHCSPLQVACDAYASSLKICQNTFGESVFPSLDITLYDPSVKRSANVPGQCQARDHPWIHMKRTGYEFVSVNSEAVSEDIEFAYVPNHLVSILFELFKNSMRAIVENHPGLRNDKLPPMKLLISRGEEDIVLKLQDEGGGMPLQLTDQAFRYTFTTCSQPILDPTENTQDNGEAARAIAGYGHGLSLSRLHAKYLSGDLQLYSIERQGTSVLIFLKANQAFANEVLPIFNRTCEKVYKTTKLNVSDWTNSTTSEN